MKIKRLGLLVILTLLIFSSGQTALKTWQSRQRLVNLELELAETQRENEELNNEVRQRGGLNYVEKEARDRLNMVKKGEHLVILPNPKEVLGGMTQNLSLEVVEPMPVWRQWFNLIFKVENDRR